MRVPSTCTARRTPHGPRLTRPTRTGTTPSRPAGRPARWTARTRRPARARGLDLGADDGQAGEEGHAREGADEGDGGQRREQVQRERHRDHGSRRRDAAPNSRLCGIRRASRGAVAMPSPGPTNTATNSTDRRRRRRRGSSRTAWRWRSPRRRRRTRRRPTDEPAHERRAADELEPSRSIRAGRARLAALRRCGPEISGIRVATVNALGSAGQAVDGEREVRGRRRARFRRQPADLDSTANARPR